VYCGTVSLIRKAAPQAPVVVVKTPSMLPLVGILGAVVVLMGVVGVVTFSSTSKAPDEKAADAQPETGTAIAEAPPAAPAEPAPQVEPEELRALDGFAPVFVDVDGDRKLELVAKVSVSKAGQTTDGFSTFDGETGKAISHIPAPEGGSSTLSVAYGKHLVTAQSSGKLTAFELISGKEQWSSMLGERAEALCEGTAPGELMVVADTGRHLLVDLTTGRQSVTKKPCQKSLARASASFDPRDRRDYRAPSDVESIRCGGVRVMGSANYTVPDQCLVRARVNTDALEGLVGHSLWRVEQDWLVLGVRTPGAYVPMVGRLHAGKLAWKSEVPLENPLEMQEGSSNQVALSNGLVVLSYQRDDGKKSFLTAFDVKDGTRRFTVEMPSSVKAVSAAPERLAVQAGSELLLLDPATGKTRVSIGTR
jgi:hypothetical protein